MVDKMALGQVFSEYFAFPCKFSFHRLLHNHHHHLVWGWYNRPNSGRSTSELSLTPPHETKKKKKLLSVLQYIEQSW
jgi:hypothetical protein